MDFDVLPQSRGRVYFFPQGSMYIFWPKILFVNGRSSFWFVTESSVAPVTAEFFQKIRPGHDLERVTAVATRNLPYIHVRLSRGCQILSITNFLYIIGMSLYHILLSSVKGSGCNCRTMHPIQCWPFGDQLRGCNEALRTIRTVRPDVVKGYKCLLGHLKWVYLCF